jgi:hypothetical protein
MHIEKLYAFICLFIYIYRFGLQHKKKIKKKSWFFVGRQVIYEHKLTTNRSNKVTHVPNKHMLSY